jgi:YVTN family beta-propeller protein
VAVNTTTNRIFVANGSTSSVSVVDGTSRTVAATVILGIGVNPSHVAVNESTGRVYVASQVAAGAVIDGSTNEVIALLSMPAGGGSVGVNPLVNRAYFAFGGNRPGVAAVDGATNVLTVLPVTFPYQPGKIAVDPVTDRIYVPSAVPNVPGTVTVISGSTGEILATIPVGMMPTDVAANGTTHRAYVANGCDKTISVIDTESSTVVTTVAVGGPILVGTCGNFLDSLAVDATRNLVYVTSPYGGSVHVLDGATNTMVTSFAAGGEPAGLDINSATGRLFVTDVAATANVVRVFDTPTNTLVAQLPAGLRPVAVAVNAAASRAYVAGISGSATVTVLQG